MTHPVPVPVLHLPDTIRSYLAAHAAGDVERALAAFSPTAEVVDEGRTFRGTAAVRDFLRTAGAEFTYTTQLLGAERIDPANWVAHNRIEGDFPGGVADLRYHVTMADDVIVRLVIDS